LGIGYCLAAVYRHPCAHISTGSIATSDIATNAVQSGARLITHLFNAMPQLHHRDPSIIGLLGASPHLANTFEAASQTKVPVLASGVNSPAPGSEALEEQMTPPQTPTARKQTALTLTGLTSALMSKKGSRGELHLDKGQIADMPFERPSYGIIVDGVHSHPNSVRVSPS
jgi:N-acetylglucosamine-6-phosphate deacetylase